MQVKFVRSLVIAATVVISAATGMVPALAQQPPAGAPAGGQGRGRGPQVPPLLMTTTAFEDGGVIPAKYVGAMGVSPELKWTQVPMGTQSFVLLFHDPEPALNKGLMDVTHWLVWNIPATATGLQEGVAQGAELPDGSRQVEFARQRLHGTRRASRPVPSLHVRAVRARHKGDGASGHAAGGRRDTHRGDAGHGRPHPRQSDHRRSLSSVNRRCQRPGTLLYPGDIFLRRRFRPPTACAHERSLVLFTRSRSGGRPARKFLHFKFPLGQSISGVH